MCVGANHFWTATVIAMHSSQTTYIGHKDISERLAALAGRWGTSAADSELERANYLGFMRLNGRCWPEESGRPLRWGGETLHPSLLNKADPCGVLLSRHHHLLLAVSWKCVCPQVPWHSIGLGAPLDQHAWIRPILVKLNGNGGRWSTQWVTEQACNQCAHL